jgi:SAM-dependent methyltransferase
MNEILEGYAKSATPELIARYNELDCAEVYAPVLDLLPQTPVRIVDIGAGTGRDAAWFATAGHRVLAVEPVKELHEPAIRQHISPNIEWLDDRLPTLHKAQSYGRFDLITLCGVWQHIKNSDRQLAMQNLGRIAASGSKMVMSLRHGPAPANRPVFAICPDETIELAKQCGFSLLRRVETGSIQAGNRALGVNWTWLAFERTDPSM